MKQFACGDVIPSCGATFRANTEDDLLRQVAEHATADHGMTVVPAEVVEAVRRATVDT